MHIGLMCHSLCAVKGGAERACVNLAHAMIERGHKVTVFGYDHYGPQPSYPLPGEARIILVDRSGRRSSITGLRDLLISLDIDVCVTFTSAYEIFFWSASIMGSGIPLVASERTSPVYAEKFWNRPGRLAAMSAADTIVLLFPEYVNSLPLFLRGRTRVIANASPVQTPAMETKPPFLLLSLGRLDSVKQLDLLVLAFTKIAHCLPEWSLEIWGEGEEKKFLKGLIASQGLGRRMRLCGETDDPESCFRRASLFCIPSRYEGLPNTVLESFSSGVPAVGFADCPGVNLLIKSQSNGMLAPRMDAESLAESLFTLMSNESLRAECGKGARATSAKYAPAVIYERWEQVLLKAAGKKGRTVMDGFRQDPFFSRALLSSTARQEYFLRSVHPGRRSIGPGYS